MASVILAAEVVVGDEILVKVGNKRVECIALSVEGNTESGEIAMELAMRNANGEWVDGGIDLDAEAAVILLKRN